MSPEPGGAARLALFLVVLASLIALTSRATAAATVDVGRSGAQPGAAHEGLPPSIDASRHYLFYLHGRIVELRGRHAVSRVHGPYRYDEIVKALADRGFIVISEVRPADTRLVYGEKVAGQIRTLLAAGVAPERITVVGFSKGGFLAIVTAAALGQPSVNFVIMAGCGIGPVKEIRQTIAPRMQGRILSLYDDADQEAGSCQKIFARASGLDAKEVTLKTGLGHGLFYAPRKEWLDLVAEWATQRR